MSDLLEAMAILRRRMDVLEELSERELDHDFGAARIDLVAECEGIIRAAQALQADQIVQLYGSRSVGSGGAAGLSVAGEVALARGMSPSAGATQLSFALGLDRLPAVRTALREGVISEPTARAIEREFNGVSPDVMDLVDAELAGQLPGLGPRRAAELVRGLIIEADPEAAGQAERNNRADPWVHLDRGPAGTATLVAVGPAEQLVAAFNALDQWARGLRAAGDPRSVGQISFETLVERITGQHHADTVDVEIGIVIDAATLVGAASHPAELVGHGPISPDLADALIGRAHRVFYRRLITDPIDGTLLGRDPRRRRFDGALAGQVYARDRRRCRQPGCECRARHIDHIVDHARGGPTIVSNAQALCERSHRTKHLPGWRVVPGVDGGITWTTPTGHTYSAPPPAIVSGTTLSRASGRLPT